MFGFLKFLKKEKSIVKVSPGGDLYITTDDLFSQPEVQQTLRDLENSNLSREIERRNRNQQ